MALTPTIQTESSLAVRRFRRGSSAGALLRLPPPLDSVWTTPSTESRLLDSPVLRQSGSRAARGTLDARFREALESRCRALREAPAPRVALVDALCERPWSRDAVVIGASALAAPAKKFDAAPRRSAFRRQGGRDARRSSSGRLRASGASQVAGCPALSLLLPPLGLDRERSNCSVMTPLSRAATAKGTRAATPSVAFRRNISEHFVQPYAEIYGMHPDLFEFDRRGEMQLTDEGIVQESLAILAQELL